MRNMMYCLILCALMLNTGLNYGQTATSTPVAAGAAVAPTPSADQLAKMEAAVLPMVTAIAALKNFQVEISNRYEMIARGQNVGFTTNIKLWSSQPDKFYMLHQVGTKPQPTLNVAAFGDSKKVTVFLSETEIYTESSENVGAVKLQTLAETNVFVALLFDSGLRNNLMKLQTPDQAVAAVSDEVYNGVPCKKVVLGRPPEELTYYYPAAGPYLPIGLINTTKLPTETVMTSQLKWVPESTHPDSIFTPALPTSAKKVATVQEFVSAVNLAMSAATTGQFTTGTVSRPTQ